MWTLGLAAPTGRLPPPILCDTATSMHDGGEARVGTHDLVFGGTFGDMTMYCARGCKIRRGGGSYVGNTRPYYRETCARQICSRVFRVRNLEVMQGELRCLLRKKGLV
jgi:hypothetical protein